MPQMLRDGALPLGITRYNRKLSDKLWLAFHDACSQAELDVARDLLEVLEQITSRLPTDGERRIGLQNLIVGHERLWALRNGVSMEREKEHDTQML